MAYNGSDKLITLSTAFNDNDDTKNDQNPSEIRLHMRIKCISKRINAYESFQMHIIQINAYDFFINAY